MVNGTNTSSAVAPGEGGDRVALLVGRGDVEEDELVGPLAVIVAASSTGSPGVADVEEFDALDDPAGVYVEAGDDALVVHRLTVAPPGPRRS